MRLLQKFPKDRDCGGGADGLTLRCLFTTTKQEMDQDEFNQKLDQIEEQAQLTLAEFPKTLTKERQRMIIALVRYIRTESERGAVLPKAGPPAEASARLRSV